MAIIKSVLAILRHENEFFFIIRQNNLRVFPGYASFPGGKVDKSEDAWEAYGEDPFLMGALRRELQEEIGLDLKNSRFIEDVRFIGNAITPDFNPYRFDASYALIALKEKPQLALDKREVAEGFWATFEEFEKRYRQGDLIVIPPIWKIRDYLLGDKTCKEEFHLLTPKNEVPAIESIAGLKQIMPLSNTLPPAERTNAFLIGSALVDPSPKNEAELEKLFNTIKGNKVDRIFITHHHGDHHQFSREISGKLNVPIYMSAYTQKRLKKFGGEDYFSNVDLRVASEGDVMCHWLGEPVRVYEVPGHDEGQLALAPDSMKWFIAGDLFQGIGTVVVGGEEGDMATYFKTLKRVIQLAPKAVCPSHGIPLGGTDILEKTLKHRELREEQIKALYEKGLTIEEMLNKIYFDIPKTLRKYAMANIHSHLKKIQQES